MPGSFLLDIREDEEELVRRGRTDKVRSLRVMPLSENNGLSASTKITYLGGLVVYRRHSQLIFTLLSEWCTLLQNRAFLEDRRREIADRRTASPAKLPVLWRVFSALMMGWPGSISLKMCLSWTQKPSDADCSAVALYRSQRKVKKHKSWGAKYFSETSLHTIQRNSTARKVLSCITAWYPPQTYPHSNATLFV